MAKTLFAARRHNAIVDRLRIDYPAAGRRKRLSCSRKARIRQTRGLSPKIHQVEGTLALLNSPGKGGRFAMRGNFWGLARRGVCARYGSASAAASPLRHSGDREPDHTPAALSIDRGSFTAVSIRNWHSMLPDEVSLRRPPGTGPKIAKHDFRGGQLREGRFARALCPGGPTRGDVLYALQN